MLHSWVYAPQSRRFLADVAVNIAIYVPLGMSAYLALRRFRSRTLEILAPVAIGALLSAAIEMAQLFTPNRRCSAVDLVNNILGSGLGVFTGFLLTQIADVPPTGPQFRVRDRRALTLLFCWIAFLLFPLFPVTALTVWKDKLAIFFEAPLLNPVQILLGAAEWFAVGRLLLAAGGSPFPWLLILLLLVPGQIAIINHNPTPADLAGAVLGAGLFFVVRRKGDLAGGIALLVALTIRGLTPFQFVETAQRFSWVPFQGVLAADWQTAIAILLGKLFQYGAAIWLLRRSGVGLTRATVLVTLVLAGIEALQTRLAGHVAEMTDPLLAILLCLGLVALGQRKLETAPKRAQVSELRG